MAKTKKNLLELVVSHHFGASASTPDETQSAFLAKNWEHLKPMITSKISEGGFGVYSVGHILKKLKKEYEVGFSEQEMRQIYEQFIFPDISKLENLASLSKEVSVTLSHEQQKRVWNNFFNSGWKKYPLETLANSFGKPELSQAQIDSICNNYLSIMAGEAEDKTRRERLQAEEVFYLLKMTGISPNWDASLAQRAYDHQIPFLDNEFCNDRFKLLQDAGASPNPIKVQEHCRSLITKQKERRSDCRVGYRDIESLASDIALILKRTSLQPDEETKTLVRKFYTRNLEGENFHAMKALEKATKIKLERELIGKVYQDFLKSGEISAINSLAEQSKVPPEIGPQVVQEAYSDLFKQAKFDSALRVYLFTDVKPSTSPKVIASGLRKLLAEFAKKTPKRDMEYQTLDWLQDNFPKQASRFAKLQLKQLIKSREFERAYDLSFHAGNSAQEESYVISCEKGFWSTAKELFEKHREAIIKSYPEYAELYKHMP